MVPVKELDHAASPIDKNEERPGEGIGSQFAADDAAEAVEGFAHVADATVQVDAGCRGQTEHGELL